MNLKTLTDSEVLETSKDRVAREKQITFEVLQCLREIEDRQLYLARGYSSLFDFCVKEYGYSEGAANRRISSMRLLRQVPEIEEKIKENKVNLSTLSQVHSHIRREEKFGGATFTKEDKLELVSKVESLSQDQCQRELLKFASEPAKISAQERTRVVADEGTEIKFVAPKELADRFEELKGLLAHKNPNPIWREFFAMLAEIALQKLKPTSKCDVHDAKVSVHVKTSQVDPDPNHLQAEVFHSTSPTCSTAAAAKRRVNSDDARSPSASLKRRIWQRDQSACQYIDPVTRKKCLGRHALQIDHIVPYALGGKTIEGNLRLLCRAHNQYRAKLLFGPPPLRSP